MDKKISYCPRCDKYLEKGSWFCPFCGAMVPKLSIWESWSEEKRNEYLKEAPHFNEPHPDKKEDVDKAKEFDAQYRAELAQEEARKQYVPRCPTCGCPDVERIGTGEKIADTVVWGFLARKPKCQFKCKNCGYEW